MFPEKIKIMFFFNLVVSCYCNESYAPEDVWMKEIRLRAAKLFINTPNKFAQIAFILHEQEKSSPIWDTLKIALDNEESFRIYAEMLIDDFRHFDGKIEKYQKFVQQIHFTFTKPADKKGDGHQGVNMKPSQNVPLSILPSMAQVWDMISDENKKAFLPVLKSYCQLVGGKDLVAVADDIAGLVNKYGGTQIMVFLASGYLTTAVIENVNLWYNGKISGTRCVKNIIDKSAAIGGGIGGGILGAQIGSAFGPGGTLLGGIIGSMVGTYTAETLSDRLNQWIFNLPKKVALENAFNYLGVDYKVSNNEINKAFHKLARKHHPDVKGGSHDEFVKLNFYMTIIKASRVN